MKTNIKILSWLFAVMLAAAVFSSCKAENMQNSTSAETTAQSRYSTAAKTTQRATTAKRTAQTAACPHEYVYHKILKEATCGEEGEEFFKCKECGYSYMQTIERLDSHELDDYGDCSVCNGNFIEQLYSFKLNADGRSYSVSSKGLRGNTRAVIPAEYKGLPVTAIAKESFCFNSTLESIFIPASINYIGEGSFRECKALQYIDIESVEAWLNIEFHSSPLSCAKGLRMNGSVIVSIEIPEGTTEINVRAFEYNKKLLSVTLPSTLEKVSFGEFIDCPMLAEIINHSPFDIAEGGNTKPYVHRGESALGCDSGFYYIVSGGETRLVAPVSDGGVENLALPESLNGGEYVIDSYAFSQRNDIETVTITCGVKEIRENAFFNCENLREVYVGECVERIKYGVFRECEKLAKLVVPFTGERAGGEGVAYIGYWFAGIEGNVVSPPRSLKAVEVTSGTKIYKDAFYNCDYIESIKIPAEVTEICEQAFFGCSGIASFDFPPSLEIIGDFAFMGARFKSFDIPQTVKHIGKGAFLYSDAGKENGEIVLPDGLEYLGEGAFKGCFNLVKITIPEGITEIQAEMFADCTALKSFTASSGLKKVGYAAFSGSGLEEITLPDTVEEIENSAFYSCKLLRRINIGKGLKYIGHDIAMLCWELKSVIYSGSEAEWNAVEKKDVPFHAGIEMVFLGQ